MSLTSIKYTLLPILIPAATSGLILYAFDLATGKSQRDLKQVFMDIGLIAGSQAAAQIIASMIPTFSESRYNDYVEAGESYLLIPVLGSLLYDYLYSKTIRENYSNNSSSLKSPTVNLAVGFGSIFVSNLIKNQMTDMIM